MRRQGLEGGLLLSLLLGAAVSSTDAAAVFASLRGTDVRRRLASILEAESGLNDPFAALLVIGLVEWSGLLRRSRCRSRRRLRRVPRRRPRP